LTTLETVALLAVLFLGCLSALRNWTAVGLVYSYIILQVAEAVISWGLVDGPIHISLYVLCDYLVLVIIFLKTGSKKCLPLPGWTGTLKTCWLQLSNADKIITLSFIPGWFAYGMTNANLAYAILWTIGLLQLIAASTEAIADWRRGRAGDASEVHPADPLLRQRYMAHGW
jgi:hypothetical protein